MNNRVSLVTVLALTSFAAGCSMISKGSSSSGGAGPVAAGPALAGTMAEAPTYHVGATIEAAAECHTSGYAKVDAPAGDALTLEVTVTAPGEACVSVHWLNANGGATGGLMEEVCTNESPASFAVTGMEGGAFLQVSEAGACQGATVKLAVR